MNMPFKLKSSTPNRERTKRFDLFAPHCLDSYKLGHKDQYPKGTELIYSNFTPRSDRHLNVPRDKRFYDGKVVVYGIYGMLKDLVALWDETFFSQSKEHVLARYALRTPAFTGTAPSVQHLADLHDLGYLPIRFKAIKEGSRVNIGVPLFTIVNTKKEFYWLTNALETVLSNESWKGMTIATIANVYRRILDYFAELTGSPKDFVGWQGHDFADRGLSGMMDAAKNGSGHSTSFLGSDSVSAFDYLAWAYSGDNTFMGGSVPATEHSVMCLGGKESEIETFRRLLKLYPSGVVSIVSDSWDFWKVLTVYAPLLKDEILARKPNEIGLSKVVFRPDSGDPVQILTGLTYVELRDSGDFDSVQMSDYEVDVVKLNGKYYEYELEWLGGHGEAYVEGITLGKEVPEHVVKGAVEVLWDIFGGDITSKGFKAVSQRVGLIYGDSITPERCFQIMQRLHDKGFAECNTVLGIGSYTYQYITRDTLGFAMKATFGVVNGEGRELFKDPVTDNGMKKSAKGLLKVLKSQEADGEKYMLIDGCDWDEEDTGELKLVFEDGNFFVNPTLADVRTTLLG